MGVLGNEDYRRGMKSNSRGYMSLEKLTRSCTVPAQRGIEEGRERDSVCVCLSVCIYSQFGAKINFSFM